MFVSLYVCVIASLYFCKFLSLNVLFISLVYISIKATPSSDACKYVLDTLALVHLNLKSKQSKVILERLPSLLVRLCPSKLQPTTLVYDTQVYLYCSPLPKAAVERRLPMKTEEKTLYHCSELSRNHLISISIYPPKQLIQ